MSTFKLTQDEQDLVADAAAAYAQALPTDRSAPYRALASAAVTPKGVPKELISALERVCALSLTSGKARELGLAEGERLLMAVFRRTPRGQSLLEQVTALNSALDVVDGQQLRSLHTEMPLPGCYVLSLRTAAITVRLRINEEGIAVDSIT